MIQTFYKIITNDESWCYKLQAWNNATIKPVEDFKFDKKTSSSEIKHQNNNHDLFFFLMWEESSTQNSLNRTRQFIRLSTWKSRKHCTTFCGEKDLIRGSWATDFFTALTLLLCFIILIHPNMHIETFLFFRIKWSSAY